MKKVVINRCYGGFGLSDEAIELYGKLKGLTLVKEKGEYFNLCGYTWYKDEVKEENFFNERDIERYDPVLAQVVEQLGDSANGKFADLKVVEIPDDVNFTVEEYDGYEHVAEVHRTWS